MVAPTPKITVQVGTHRQGFEINLKKYYILGGIYELYFVEKPRHYNLGHFNMTWHMNNGELIIRRDVITKSSTILPQFSSNRFSTESSPTVPESVNQKFSKSISSRASEALALHQELDPQTTPLFILTFKLPQYMCMWGEPLPCHYEADAVEYINTPSPTNSAPLLSQASTSHLDNNLSNRQSRLKPVRRYSTASMKTPDDLSSVPNQESGALDVLHQTPSAIFASRMSLGSLHHSSNIFRPSMLSLAIQQAELAVGKDKIFMEDFPLDQTLTKDQIHNIRRYCMPRMLSSFRFPKELKDYKDEEKLQKSKGKGGALIRRRVSNDESAQGGAEWLKSYSQQTNPERVFPMFEAGEPLYKSQQPVPILENLNDSDPETFFELVDTLNSIKRQYQRKHEHTTNAPFFVSKMKFKKPKSDETQPENQRPVKRVASSKGRSTFLSIKSRGSVVFENKLSRRSILTPTEETDKEVLLNDDTPNAPVDNDEQPHKDDRPTITYAHWTTEHIRHFEFDREAGLITLWTDRLGTIGFAYKRYEHFPFRFWSLEPSVDNPDTEIILTIETKYLRCVLKISSNGYSGYVTEPSKKFVRNRAMYLTIEKPLTDFKELKKLFRERNVNIFSDRDARFYIENGYFSEKHLAAEFHTYSCMAINCLQMKFAFSDWNRLAERRDIVLNLAHRNDSDENMLLVHVTPEEATFVDITELCSDDLDKIQLSYASTWRNIDYYADVHQLIQSMFPMAYEMRVKDPLLLSCVKNVLREIRPLSFS